MVIDAHVHLIKPFDRTGKRQVYSSNPASPEEYLAVMEAAGVDRAFFISYSPEDIPADLAYKRIPMDAVRDTMNREFALEVMRRFPERLYWFPCHIGSRVPNRMETARENLELGAAGIKLVLSFWGELPDDPQPLALCALAREYGACVIVDTSYWNLGKDMPDDPHTLLEGHREVAPRVKDYPDYLRHLDAMVRAFPEINFSLAHAGAREFTPGHAREIGSFIRGHANVFADLGALDTGTEALDLLVESAGPDRVMFGTDWPHYAQGAGMQEAIDRIRRPGRFPRDVAAAILGGNALSFVSHRPTGLASPGRRTAAGGGRAFMTG